MRSPHSWSLVTDAILGYGSDGAYSPLHARVFEADPTPPAGAEGAEPVVLLSEFGDHVGTSITNSIEDAAAAAQARFYPDGQTVRLVLMYPHARHSLDRPVAPLSLREVGFAHRAERSRLGQWVDRRRARRHVERGSWQFAVTAVGPDGVTRHVLPALAPSEETWDFQGPTFGRELALEVPDDERAALVGVDSPHRDQLRFTYPTTVRVPALLGETRLPVWPEELYTAELVAGPEVGAYANARRAAVRRYSNAKMNIIGALTDPASDSYTELGAVHSSDHSSSPHPDSPEGESPIEHG